MERQFISHPALNWRLAKMPARLAADWEMWLHSTCSCAVSAVSGFRLLLKKRPDIAHCRVNEIAERLRCKVCTEPFDIVALSDGGCSGPYETGWQLELVRRIKPDYGPFPSM